MKLKVGDIVKLRSGGADMTVTASGKRQVGVAWMFGGTLHQANLPAEALTRPENESDRSSVDMESPNEREADRD